MSTQDTSEKLSSLNGVLAARFEDLSRDLTHMGDVHMQKTLSTLDAAAPKPGSLVYLTARTFSVKLNGLEPVVFSAVDACTFLQVAQIYLAPTTAAAVLFFDFAKQSFPFPLTQVRTRNQRPFNHTAPDRSFHGFTEMVGERGCPHVFLTNVSRGPFFDIADRFTFGSIVQEPIVGTSDGKLQRDLVQFLFFHNNYRPILWLEGKTPLQKLITFEGFAGRHSFDPQETFGRKNGEYGEHQKEL